MKGTIVKILSGFYYVRNYNWTLYECSAKGSFRNDDITPLVGDEVEFDIISTFNRTGVINEILPRKNSLVRPAVANVDQAMVVFALDNPRPNFSILDRFLVLMQKQNIETIIVFNKKDLARLDDVKNIKKMYKNSGCKLYFVQAGSDTPHLFWLKMKLRGKVTVMAGPSGVGKSTMLNVFAGVKNDEMAQVGEISRKIGRGKHTTRHNEIYSFKKNSIHIIDTPGFTSLLVNEDDFSKEELQNAFPEFNEYKGQCKFSNCNHIKTRDCAIEKAVMEGKIPQSRYNSYKSIYGEIKSQAKY